MHLHTNNDACFRFVGDLRKGQFHWLSISVSANQSFLFPLVARHYLR